MTGSDTSETNLTRQPFIVLSGSLVVSLTAPYHHALLASLAVDVTSAPGGTTWPNTSLIR